MMDTSPTGFDHECLLLALATSLLHAYETSPALTSSINVYKYNTYTVYYVLVCTACPQTRQLEKPPRRNANATDSKRSDECIDFTMMCFFCVSVYSITCRNNAPISNFGGGFRCKSEYPWYSIEVKKSAQVPRNPVVIFSESQDSAEHSLETLPRESAS
ncbi:Uncharacterized protein FWK35_00036051, partial [Aphis craccivora]